MKQALFDFYNFGKPNPNGVTVESIINASDEWWENQHDFIQWAFPNNVKSGCNPNAPILAWHEFEFLSRESLELLLGRFFQFLKNNKDFVDGVSTHNDLRVTRALKCATLFSFKRHDASGMSINLFWQVMGIVQDRKKWDTVKYWHKACEGWR